MTEFIASLEDFKRLPTDLHLLCPRRGDDDQDRYEDDIENTESATKDGDRSRRIGDTKARRKKFIDCLQLLAYDGSESSQYQKYIWNRIDDALGRCDICIRNYYVARLEFLSRLREEYDEEDIKNFFTLIDRQDIARISRGLNEAARTLRNLPEQKRGTGALRPEHLHAVFEALVCDAFLRDEQVVTTHFDEPFRLIQTKKPLKIREILPATVHFLFGSNSFRLQWATSIWDRIERPPTELEWTWAMRDVLEQRMQQASTATETTRLWGALRLIASRLDENIISHKLFDLQPQICTTALNHLNRKSPAVPYITQTLKVLVTKASTAYWQAMGSISSQTVIEQIFSSPQFDSCLQDSVAVETKDSLDVLSWIPAFLQSLKLGNRPVACRAIVSQLFNRTDAAPVSDAVRLMCFKLAVKAMMQTIVSFADSEQNRQSVERLVLKETLNMIGGRIGFLLKPRPAVIFATLDDSTRSDVTSIVRNALALENQCLKIDFDLLSNKQHLKHESSSYTPVIWDAVIASLSNEDTKLSSSVLLGIMALPGLEQFRTRSGDNLTKEKRAFNTTFDNITKAVSRALEKITDFSPSHLDLLFKQQDTSMSLIAALFSPDEATAQAAGDLIKNVSGDSSRKDALGHLLEAFFSVTLYSLCWSMRRIANLKTFSSVPRMLKTGMDVLEVLCNPAMGKLRRVRFEDRDYAAIQRYWSYQWAALGTVFSKMEQWSMEIHDKAMMTDVCRDAMQYADELFEQYDIFHSVLSKGKSSERPEDVSQTLLDSPKAGSPVKTLDVMVKWLRLRDQFLADTLVQLIVKMLYRLKRHQPSARIDGLNYVEEVATKTSVKTILSETQKAMLAQALETFTGKEVVRAPKRQQSSLRGWTDAAASASGLRQSSYDDYGDDDIGDDDLQEVARRAIPKPTREISIKDKVQNLGLKPQPIRPKQADHIVARKVEKEAQDRHVFLENRRKEEAARKARDKEASARLRGLGGSGLAGIGVKGKDHAVVGSPMMVSSESESDNDSDEDLFGDKIARPPTSNRGPVRRNIPAGPVRKIKQVRTQKDIRARLAPDLTNLHKTILGWDFFIDADLPPSSAKDDYTMVTSSFRNAEEYKKTFEPLLVLEGWQGMRAQREDGSFQPYEFKVANSLLVDSFFEINATMPMAQGQELGLGTADVVLLSRSSSPHKDIDSPHCLARIKEVSRKKGEFQVVYRVNAASNSMRQHLSDKATVYGAKIMSMTTLEREYGALTALPYYDLCDEIVAAKPSPLLEYPDHELQNFIDVYDVNQAQAKAVKSAIDNDAFTLIQGPPGTGKTKTICALVGAMMTGYVHKHSSAPRLNTAHAKDPSLPPAAKKILVCAPSNAAVDELVMRFKQGIKMTTGFEEKLQVVRLGRGDAINSQVRDVTLEELVSARLENNHSKDQKEDVYSFMQKHKGISEQVLSLRSAMDDTRSQGKVVSATDEKDFDLLKREKAMLGTKIDSMREKQNTASRDAELSRKRIQQEILDSAHVLCATLSGSGHEIFQGLNVEFDTVIIDEAAQSIELSALIPLKYGCSKCILVGDPKQLPPTVLSREAARFQYEQSLFARMEKNHKKDIHLLDTQYRMHPEISVFPSRMFYDSRLKDGGNMAKLRARPWHHSNILGPYRFFDVQGMSQSQTKGHSLVNYAEIDVAMQLYERVTRDVPKYNFKGKIGVITPYKGQRIELKKRFQARYGEDIIDKIEFNTIDAFQGRESEIIIFSCVRASTKGIGFLNDIRRMNVGLTRAKCSLWVLGNAQSLVQGEFWRGLVNDSRSRNLYTDGDINSVLSRPLLTEDMMKDDINMMDADEPRVPLQAPTTNGNSSVAQKGKPDLTPQTVDSPSVSANGTPAQSRPSSAMSRKSSSSSVVSVPRPQAQRAESTTKNMIKKATLPSGKDNVSSSHTMPRRPSTTVQPDTTTAGVNGPSGGRYGLNPHAVCNTCGSADHFSHNCPNTAARAVSMGACHRCQQNGHTLVSCTTPRCLECGAYGHLGAACAKPKWERLSKQDKDEVSKQEIRFGKQKDAARAKRAERQLGEHGVKVPAVRETLPLQTPTEPRAKRPLESGADVGVMKAPRTSAVSANPNGNPNGSVRSGGPVPPRMGGPGQPKKMIKKKQGGDVFVKRK